MGNMLFLCVLAFVVSTYPTVAAGNLRPPCAPLSVVSPYQSMWSCSTNLFDAFPKHWAGATIGQSIMAEIDGEVLRLMGPPDMSTTSLETPSQVDLVVSPTSTQYVFHDPSSKVELNVTWTTPAFSLDDDENKIKDLPITYLTFSSMSLDENDHDVKIYFDTTAEGVVKNVKEEVEMSRASSSSSSTTLSIGTTSQDLLSSNDDRLSWGYQRVSMLATNPTLATSLSSDVDSRTSFAASSPLPNDDTDLIRNCDDKWPVLAFSFSMKVSPVSPTSEFLLLSFDEIQTMDYFGTTLKPFWKTYFEESSDMIEFALKSYDEAISSSRVYDVSHMSALEEVGGQKYAQLLSLIHRQVTGGLAKTQSPNDDGETWMWMKEISSDGDISTVDVIYPAAPFFIYTAPETLRRMFLPLLVYSANATGASSEFDYDLPWAPHHLGVWPTCNILAKDQEQMPVEESGNFLIMIAAVAQSQNGDVSYLSPYWDILRTWADYNVGSLPDPGEQLCTDDFEGPSPHNVNLAAKGIVSLGAYSILLSMKGDDKGAEEYMNVARELVGNWTVLATDVDGTHTKLQYNLDDDTWSMKYNLLFDRVLGLELFPQDVVEKDLAYYDDRSNAYGIPLDSRASSSKSDWLMWMYAMGSDDQFEAQVEKLWKFANETPSRVPLTDWYDTVTGEQQGFQARPVQGGLYARMLVQ